MDKATAQKYLEQADESIEKAGVRITRHEAKLKRLVAIGCDTEVAKETLEALKKLL